MGKYETNNANCEYADYEKKELQPRYDTGASFYKKAYIIYLNESTILLQSYNTIVAHVENEKYTSYGKYSQTTSRHQKEFQRQFAYNN